MTDILFICPFNKYKNFEDAPPLSMAGIASYTHSKGFSVKIIDYAVESRTVKSLVSRYSPLIVCIEDFYRPSTETRFESFRIAKEIKDQDPSIITVYEGTHASFTSDETLTNIPYIDLIVRGEAEETILELAQYFLRKKGQLKKIKGISYKKDSQVMNNPSGPSSKNLDKYKIDYNLIDITKYSELHNNSTAILLTSRGCEYKCSFCIGTRTWKSFAKRSVKSVVDEIEFLLNKYRYRRFKFFDSNLTMSSDYIKSICNEINKRNLDIQWDCRSRADSMNSGILTLMKSAGCRKISFGIESASQRILNRIGKNITLQQADDALKNLRKLGIKSKVFFIYGLPGETFKDALQTYRFIRLNKSRITKASAEICYIYPGTPVETFSRQNRILPLDFSWSSYFYKPNLRKDFNTNPHVPLLIQPSLNYNQLKQIFEETYKEISYSTLKRKISDVGTSKGTFYSLKSLGRSALFRLKYGV